MYHKLRVSLKRKVWQWRAPLITAPVVAGIAIAINSLGWLETQELGMLDRFFRWRPKEAPEERIVIVTIDESDIRQVGQWPMPDHDLARLIQTIREQQPAAIGLDLYRDLPVEPGHQELVEVIKSTPNLIGVEKVIGAPVAAQPTLSDLGQVGIADVVLDDDGKIRRTLLSHKNTKDETQLSFPALLSLIYLEKQDIHLEMLDPERMHLGLGKAVFVPFSRNDGGYVRANAGGYQMLLNYRGPLEKFGQISMTEVLDNQIPPDLMRDRIVLIGATAPSLNDFFFTPYISGFHRDRNLLTNSERTPGIVIHANTISQMLSAALEGRPFLQVWSNGAELLWIMVWSGVGAAIAWGWRSSSVAEQKRIWPPLLILNVLIGGASTIAIGFVAFLYSWWIPVVTPLVALVGSAIVITDYHSRKLLRDRDRKLTEFLEAVPVGISIVDARGHSYFINHKATEILGIKANTSEPTNGNKPHYQNYMAGTDHLYPLANLPVSRALQGEYATANDIEIRQGDQIIPIEAWGTPIYDEEGNVAFAIVAFQNISDRKQAESERQAFVQKLCELNEDLERSLDAEERLTEVAERFVPNQFLSFLGYESLVEVKVGDAVEQEMSVLFSDIRNFTTLSESMTPDENFKFINGVLSRLEPAIIENNGFIDKYIGDAIMALFGGEPDNAVKAGISMLEKLAEYNSTRGRPGRPNIKIGIGINTGSLMLGTVGGQNRIDGTVIGDAVNLASRIETLTKSYGVSLLITQETFLNLENPNDYHIRLIDRVTVKGKSKEVTVYEVFDADLPEVREGKLKTRADFEQGILFFYLNNFNESKVLFEQCLSIHPGDTVAQIYLDRCHQKEAESLLDNPEHSENHS